MAHFQAEVHRRLTRCHRRIACDGQGQGGLAHGRTGPKHDQRAGLEAIELGVQVGEARGGAGDRTRLLVHLLESIERVAQQITQRHQGVGDPALGNPVDQRLGGIHGGGHVVGRLKAQLGDLRRGRDQTPQEGVLLDHLGVMDRVGHRCRRALQLDERAGAADGVQQAVAGQLVGHQDGVDRRTRGVETGDGIEHVAVGRLIKIGCLQALHRIADGRRTQQHRAQ